MVKPPRIFGSYAWIECKLKSIVELSPRVVWIFGEVLVSEAKREAFDYVVNVELVGPLHQIWGDDYVVRGIRKKFKR